MTTYLEHAYEFLGKLLSVESPENAVLYILNYGLPRFLSEIKTISAATGMSEEELHELAYEATLGSDPNAPRRDEQHLVSLTLLRGFRLATPKGLLMGHYSTEYGLRPDVEPRGVAKLDRFVKIDSRRTEEVWGRVETDLPAAIAAAEAGCLFEHPEHVNTLKEAIALHYARSFDVKNLDDKFWKQSLSEIVDNLRSSPGLVDTLYRLKTGSDGAPAISEKEMIIRKFHDDIANLVDSGVMFRYRVVHLFKQATDLIADAGLEILRPPADSEFLIGDVPVITSDQAGLRQGIEAGMPIGGANIVVMPFSPTLLVSLAKTDADRVLPAAWVERVNTWQIKAAQRGIFARPGSPLLAWAATVRPPSQHTSGPRS
ncbi:DUF4238 domain-containing protein [Ferrimicrobium sp.]|uniref:DUF4238 domain-containing protein n=1 Tax=Ferrimicrobium sp. TaxID=2926050 RepID=UPI0026360AD7|nr:DUF4238 domain-containing protein [Ferrimicrobium sp.]